MIPPAHWLVVAEGAGRAPEWHRAAVVAHGRPPAVRRTLVDVIAAAVDGLGIQAVLEPGAFSVRRLRRAVDSLLAIALTDGNPDSPLLQVKAGPPCRSDEAVEACPRAFDVTVVRGLLPGLRGRTSRRGERRSPPGSSARRVPDRIDVLSDAERAPLRLPAIVSAARAMIQAGGIESLSLRRLAGRLGVTAPALYAHVSDKAGLLRLVAEDEFGVLIDRLQAVDDPDPVARLRGFGRAYVAYARANPELFRTMFLFPPDVLADGMEEFELPSASKAFGLAASAVEEAVAAGRMPGADPLLAALAFWAGAHGVATVLNLDPGIAGGLSEVGDALVDTVIDRLIAGFTGELPSRGQEGQGP